MVSLRHIGVTVTDMDRSLELYQKHFGLEVVWDQIEAGPFIDSLSGIEDIKVRTVKMKDKLGGMIELLQYHSHPEENEENSRNKIIKIGCSHLAVTVNDVDEAYKELSALGLKFNCTPQLSPDGGARVCFCRDYDGTLIEIVEEVK